MGQNYRDTIINKLIPYFQKDDRFILAVGDMGFGKIDEFKVQFPDRIYNFGIMEQGAVGICAGMALSGMTPIFYSIVNFLCFRALEQIRNDVVLQKLNVKFIGTGADNYFKLLGGSHCCGKDDIKILKLIGIDVWNPYVKGVNIDDIIEDWITSDKAGYIRV